MAFTNIISLLGGLGAFLFGMEYMGDGLQLAAGSKMKDLLEKLTRNRILGFLLGVFVTAVIQSSSATTVMVMGFLNAGIMDLAQATGVIFGANIGTTVTSILIALDVSAIAPFCLFIGAFLMLYSKRTKTKHIGQIILGFGLLFQGLSTMSASMKPLQEVPWFQSFIMNADSPILGILVGAALCAVIQSSSAAVGIVQALAAQGLMPLYFASFLVCGINIGSAMPTILASLNARNNAKRASLIYLINNLVGAVIMTLVTLLLPYTQWVERMVANPAFQISVIHILFKVGSALVLLPFVEPVVQLTYLLVPKAVHEEARRLAYIDVNLAGAPAVTMLQIRNEVGRMATLVRENISLAMDALLAGKRADATKIEQNESTIDYLTDAISDYLVKLNVQEMSDRDAVYINHVFQALGDLERIGDYAENLLHQTQRQDERDIPYSPETLEELQTIYTRTSLLFDRSVDAFYSQDTTLEQLRELTRIQMEVRKLTTQSKARHMDRLRQGLCSMEAGILFGEILNSLNRIGGHAINIAEAATTSQGKPGAFA